MTTYIGIDPGSKGGVAVIAGGTGGALVDVLADKFEGMTEHDLASHFETLRDCYAGSLVTLLELVGPNRNQRKGEVRQGASSMFTFGRNYGTLRGILVALDIAFDDVRPVAWQRAFGLLGRDGETDTQKKNRHKAKAQQLFPQLVITHATSDALLIAEYARRQATGQLTTKGD